MATSSTDGRSKLRIVPVSWNDARAFVGAWHRKHGQPLGCVFRLGVADADGVLRGVAIVGRPVARHFDDGLTLEVLRTATDGTPNANSALYGATWRAAKALGYGRLVTYTHQDESGASLRGAGWRVVAEREARRGWNSMSRPRTDRGLDHIPRTLWEATSG
jgi:hypothetical protein